ncbi:hypothetical protein SAMN00777080_2738 [Aquiflexum balticum DSM 16537]|uniref:Uncharacterized protein n=1 Tax=Aquiflexum balticum DSM 16537 TaxID=758820 RepID=A0A1W2H5D0_9BACT|nr:hypothetical protein [Aquiflexum balticum]SMD44123.1 hypothetical protein SAMN00777080_2738 [Aquiflexum balticum DSM 16537]
MKEILKLIESMPTMMDVDQELKIINMLMEYTYHEVVLNEKDFLKILDALQTSHMQTIFEVNKNNYYYFLRFSNWLDSITKEFKSKDVVIFIFNVSETMKAVMN